MLVSRGQCTGTHARNHGELGPGAQLAPTHQYTGTIRATPGNRQIVVLGVHDAAELALQCGGILW
tara:strand:+ start:24335 stop:24529 length:195 start_codon:yes stop_codon:yes gene_type:complete